MDTLRKDRSRKRGRIVEDDEMEVEEKQPAKRGRRRPQNSPSPKIRDEDVEPEPDEDVEPEPDEDVEPEPDEDTEYFEDDVEPLALIVAEGVAQKLALPKDTVLKVVKDVLQNASILTDEYCRSRPADRLWKVGMDPKVARRLEPELYDLREELEAERITIPKILNSYLSREHKKRALEWYDTLQNMEPYTAEFVTSHTDLVAFIKKNTPELPRDCGSVTECKATIARRERYLETEEKEVLAIIGSFPSYRERILELNAPREVKACIYERWCTLKNLSETSDEHATQKQWLDHALSLPYNQIANFVLPDTPTAMNDLLLRVQRKLDEKVYGLSKVKQELLQVLAQRIANPLGRHPNLALVGAPGVGKSLIYGAVAEAYGIPFERVSLGGLHDPAVLKGHSSTYVGAEPGLIVKILKRIKCSNGMIFFDELDKLGQTERGREVQYALLHIMDATTNKDFRDTYLADLSLDLSKLWFVVAMNHSEWLDSAMRDRMHLLHLKSYKRQEKEEIVGKFLIPEAVREAGLPVGSVTFTPEATKRLVGQLPPDGNIRPLKDEIALIVGRVNLYRTLLLPDGSIGQVQLDFTIPNFKLPLVVTPELLDRLRPKKEDADDDLSKRMMYL